MIKKECSIKDLKKVMIRWYSNLIESNDKYLKLLNSNTKKYTIEELYNVFEHNKSQLVILVNLFGVTKDKLHKKMVDTGNKQIDNFYKIYKKISTKKGK